MRSCGKETKDNNGSLVDELPEASWAQMKCERKKERNLDNFEKHLKFWHITK